MLSLVCLLMAAMEAAIQADENRTVAGVAARIIQEAGAKSPYDRVIAIRNHVRSLPTTNGKSRPFFRPSAPEILAQGADSCGDTSRLFVCLASAVGVPCQRLMFYRSKPYVRTPLLREHVVVEVELEPGQSIIVDARSSPEIPEPAPLDVIIQQPRYERYSTINLGRLRLDRIIARLKLEVGPWGLWLERPHAMKSTFWLVGAVLWVAAAVLGSCLAAWRSRAVAAWVHRAGAAPVVAPHVAQVPSLVGAQRIDDPLTHSVPERI